MKPSDTAFTPGPYHHDTLATNVDVEATEHVGGICSEDWTLATVWADIGGGGRDEAMANAALFAAAPTLYEALTERDGTLIQNVLINAYSALRRAGENIIADQIWQISEWQREAIQKACGEKTP